MTNPSCSFSNVLKCESCNNTHPTKPIHLKICPPKDIPQVDLNERKFISQRQRKNPALKIKGGKTKLMIPNRETRKIEPNCSIGIPRTVNRFSPLLSYNLPSTPPSCKKGGGLQHSKPSYTQTNENYQRTGHPNHPLKPKTINKNGNNRFLTPHPTYIPQDRNCNYSQKENFSYPLVPTHHITTASMYNNSRNSSQLRVAGPSRANVNSHNRGYESNHQDYFVNNHTLHSRPVQDFFWNKTPSDTSVEAYSPGYFKPHAKHKFVSSVQFPSQSTPTLSSWVNSSINFTSSFDTSPNKFNYQNTELMKNIQSLTSNSSYTREGYDDFIRNTLTHFNLVGHLLNICLINARSICNKKTDLALFVSIYQPSVIMISEAWTNSNISDRSISLDNYSLYRSDRLNGRGGGCLIYAHSSLNSLLCDMPELNKLKDSVWIVLKPSNSVTLLLGCVYRQPNASIDEIAVLSEVFTLASSLSFTGKLICGDFNMPEISWLPVKAPRRHESFIECLELGQWTQYVDSPTRHQNILDLVFTSGLIPNTLYIGKKFPGSDHNIVICSLNVKTTTDRSKTVTLRRNYRKVDWNNFHNYLRSTDWRTFFTSDNTDTLTNIFYQNIKSIINNIAPLEYCRPTFSRDLYIAVSTRRRLRRHCTRSHNLNDFSSLVTMTEILVRTEAISKQKAVAQEKRAVELNNNSSALTILLQNKLKRSKSRGSIFIKGKQVYEDPKLITELFSEHFCSSLTNERPFNDSEPIPVTPCEITNVEFSVQNISKAISTLKHSYTEGPDGIPSSMLKRGGDDMCVLLLKLFAISLSSACYPTAWKTTHIIPKIKTGKLPAYKQNFSGIQSDGNS
ncbi:unnamed protein product [Schistosoma intercalatum]|nr:unnamed protein product [Schistosoma intercalatum]